MANDSRGEAICAAIQQPAPLRQEGNLATNWREWKHAFDYFLIATGKETASIKEKYGLFMHCLGQYGREILEELDVSEQEKDYETLCKKYSEYCDPKKNVNYERHTFFETYQNEHNFDKYLGLLKKLSKNCEFGSLKSSLILTQLIRGLKDTQMKEKLLARSSITLEEASTWCRAAERASKQAAACASRGPAVPAALERLQRGAPRPRRPPAAGAGRPDPAGGGSAGWRGRQRSAATSSYRFFNDSVCEKCNLRHSKNIRCPGFSGKCFRCNMVGHRARFCTVKFTREVVEEPDFEEERWEDECSENGELLMSNISIEASNKMCDSWCETIEVDGVCVQFKLDSGAEASVMSLSSYEKAGFDKIKLIKCNTVLREISKNKLPVIGYFNGLLKFKEQVCNEKIYVLNNNCNNLLGLKACITLKLIARLNQVSLDLKKYESIFEGIGCLPTVCKIVVDKTVLPVVSASRKIPMKMRPRLKEELENMVKLNIIKKEDEPTDWVSNIVIVEKPDKKLRLCLDPRNLNQAIKRSHFQLPTLDEMASNLSGAKYFSKCDAKNGFWMIRLDESSSKLCTFSTPYGRYRFLRMPFGINCAPEIFHNEMDKIFKMEGVEVFIDDILIWGRTKEEHDIRLKEVMKRAVNSGIKFNKNKCVFSASQVTFLGHIFSSKGISPDKNRISAIENMQKPADKKGLERFLGVTNYLSRFIPRYSELSAPLRELLGQNNNFEWSDYHDRAFNLLKAKISSAPVLKYYNPEEAVTVSVDASARGLGACLLQGGRPVAYAARTLTATEQRWAQIEKELLAIVFGCTRFHQYIYGHDNVTVESDHKPLEAIFKKSLNEAPARLQRMLLKLQQYCIKIQYKPGKMLFIADTLSRAATEQGTDEDVCKEVMIHLNTLYDNVEATPEMLNKIREETGKDGTLTAVGLYYKNGWPDNKRDTDIAVRQYWMVRSELHRVKGILFRNNRVVIPTSLRKDMLKRIHEGHMGVEKCQRRARDVMWWPGMSTDIQHTVQACDTCQRHRAANPREPLQPHPVPDLPWEVLAADIFELRDKYYLVVVDYYSKFVEVLALPNMMSSSVINVLKDIFSRFGIPSILKTDNAGQFSSEQFKSFTNTWGFTHVTSSPLYPRSNGLAERNVRTIKDLMRKSYESGEDWKLALLNFRNTPLSGEKWSPAQLLMSRRLNTRLPSSTSQLKPKAVSPQAMLDKRSQRIAQYKSYYDRGTKNLIPLSENEPVRMRQNNEWVKSRVLRPAQGNRSYWVQTENGAVYRRNRQHIMKVPSQGNVANHTNMSSGIDWDHLNSGSTGSTNTETEKGPQTARPPQLSHAPKVTSSGRIVRPPARFDEEFDY
nr:uncharacterized protein LOC117996432 [Maniola hyperantus]